MSAQSTAYFRNMDVEMKVAGPARKGKRKAGKSPYKRARLSKSPAMQKGSNNERKWVDIRGVQAFNTTGSFTLINGLIRGTDSYQRVGRRIKMTRVNVRGIVTFLQAGAAPGADLLRLQLIYDREANGATPALADILQDTSNAGATTVDSLAGLNLNNSDRFAVLKEWYWSIPAASNSGGAATGSQAVPTMTELCFKFTKKCNLDVRFNSGNAGTSADITTGALYVVASGALAAANAQWEVVTDSRIRYVDA